MGGLNFLAFSIVVLIVIVAMLFGVLYGNFLTLTKNYGKWSTRYLRLAMLLLYCSIAILKYFEGTGSVLSELPNNVLSVLIFTIIFGAFDAYYYLTLGLCFLILHKRYTKFSWSPKVAQTNIKELIEKIFSSKVYHKALTSSIPKGKIDKNHGLDYVPYILSQIADKKENFKTSYAKYLKYTFAAGVIFTSVVLYLGGQLIKEDALGINKNLILVNEELSEIRSNIEILNLPSPEQENDFKLIVNELINNQPEVLSGTQYDSLAPMALREISSNYNLHNIQQLKEIYQNVYFYFPSEEQYLSNLENLIEYIDKYDDKLKLGISRIESSGYNLESKVANLQESVNEDAFQTSQLIKRLVLSLLIVSFLIAVLKFISNIYRRHFEEYLNAEEEELKIKKYFVAFKSEDGNITDRSRVIDHFMAGKINKDKKVNPESHDSVLIKELIGLIKKKI